MYCMIYAAYLSVPSLEDSWALKCFLHVSPTDTHADGEKGAGALCLGILGR